MPSLEILDISRNKIKRLPPQCGTLKGLRVSCIYHLIQMTKAHIVVLGVLDIEEPSKALADIFC